MLKPGTVLSQRYRIQDVLGQGGMGAVYLAEAEALGGKKVAVKEMIPWGLPPHELDQAVAQFKKEASFLAYLEHPNLVPVTDFFVEDSKHYLVMAYIKGQTLLEKMMQRGRPFHWVEIAPWVDRLLDVLEYLHTQSILFRDLKPSNIMVSDDGRLHLIDFGIARSASQGQKTTTFLQGTGTRGFSPIEQYGDRLSTDQRSDIYALGATLYYLLSGSVPPDAVERVSRRKKIVPLSEKLRAAPPCLDGILQKAMALSSFDRYQNVAELRKALVALDPFTAFLPSQDSGVLPFGTRADLSQSVAEQTRVEPVRWRGLVQALGCFLLSGVLIFSFSAELSAADLTHSGQRSDSIASASQAGVSGREVASESKASARIPSTAASSKSTALLPTLNLAPTPEPDLAQQSSKKVEPIIAWESYPKAARVQRTIHAIQTETVSEPEEKQVEPSVAPKLRAVRTVTTQQTGPSGPVVQAPIYVMPPDGTVSGWESSTSSTTSSPSRVES